MYLHALVHLQVSQLLKYLDWNKTYYLIAAKLSLNNWLFYSEFLSLSRKYLRDICQNRYIFLFWAFYYIYKTMQILSATMKSHLLACVLKVKWEKINKYGVQLIQVPSHWLHLFVLCFDCLLQQYRDFSLFFFAIAYEHLLRVYFVETEKHQGGKQK